jgi:putative selenate reductase YgfK subunit
MGRGEKIKFKKLQDYPDIPVSTATTRYNKTGSWRNLRPIIKDKAAPCSKACPTNTLIPQYFNAFIDEDITNAGRILTLHNPFPSITGRVCPAFCQTGCNRRKLDERISIREIERVVGDAYLPYKAEQKPEKEIDKRIAVVGAGPAGLTCAFYLRKMGYKVKVFEKEERAGGVLRYGIPEYRLPKEILDKEIEVLDNMGIEFEYGKTLGKDITVESLKEKFDAVFIGIGAHVEKRMRIEGEEYFLSGARFLKEVALGKKEPPGKKIAVVGGGNVAMDVVRTLLRLGAEPLILYRRTENEMPALKEEIEKAKEDGIEFKFLTVPVKAKQKDGKIVVTNIKMKLGEPDKSGRRRPVPVEGSEYDEIYDAVITAIGEESDRSCVPEGILGEDGWVYADKKTGATRIEGVFAGGDFVQGPSTVVEAFGWGRKSAEAIDRYLRGEDIGKVKPPERTVSFMLVQMEYFEEKNALKPRELTPKQRIKSLDIEENPGFTKEEALEESLRCFSCGVCNSCGICYSYCPDAAILWKNNKPEVDYDYCKGCGLCAKECPRGIIAMEQEV